MLALAVAAKTSLGVRRGLIIGALFLSLSASGFCLYALHIPWFRAKALLERFGEQELGPSMR